MHKISSTQFDMAYTSTITCSMANNLESKCTNTIQYNTIKPVKVLSTLLSTCYY